MATELTGTTGTARGYGELDAPMAALLARAGESGAIIAGHDWSRTPVGPIARWPPELRHALSLCLQSRDPLALWWGGELVMFHNDAYRELLGSAQPAAIGRWGESCWPENWTTIAPLLRGVLAGSGATRACDVPVFLDRKGYLEECFFTFSYSPIDDLGPGAYCVGGVFGSVVETTEHVRGERWRRTRVDGLRTVDRAEAIAGVLQQRLLPDALPATDGVTASAAYVPGSNVAEVGGDWYELLVLDDGRRLIVAIGDMVGRGIAAAAAMSELRNALRLLAAEGTQPADALGRLNEFVHTVASGHFATCWYGCIDRDAMTLTYSSAGQVPPLVIEPGRAPRALDSVLGPPVGARRGATYTDQQVDLASGSTLLLYTDGLVEHGLDPDVDPIDRLLEQATDPEPHALTAHLLASLPADEARRDDTAVLAVRVEDLAHSFHREIPLALTALSGLRRDLRDWLDGEHIDGAVTGEVVLGVCEIVTNAVEHALDPQRPVVAVDARRRGDMLEIEVRDSGHWRTRRNQPERGRGIAIARQLLDVDIERSPEGTTVRLCRRLAGTA